MPRFQVRKSILIDAPVEQVHAIVRDFRRWPEWSPWLIAEPETKLSYPDDGKSYTWEGEVTGSGAMVVTGGDPPWSIHYRLTFLKPWKSENNVEIHLSEHDGGTEVVWTMEGKLPFFMFWMKGMMSTWIGADYARGLLMLKDLAETGSVPSKLEFHPGQAAGGFRYSGVRSQCATDAIGPSMQADMAKLMALVESGGIKPAGKPFSITHRWDPVKGVTDYTLGLPVEEFAAGLPAGFVSGEVPVCEAYVVEHTGAYRHLGNAWASGVMHGRAGRYKANKRIEAFEVYENDPTTTPEAQLVTRVHFPVK